MLRHLNVPAYTQNFEEDFNSGYSMISDISAVIRERPIDVDQVELLTNELRVLATRLEDAIVNDVKYAQSAEEVIVSLKRFPPPIQ